MTQFVSISIKLTPIVSLNAYEKLKARLIVLWSTAVNTMTVSSYMKRFIPFLSECSQ